jgi:pantoate--beta-alanine ligase
MPLIRTLTELQEVQNSFMSNACGLVPTMGALHKGHLALIEKALAENEIVWVSIFVNPTQFNNSEDLKNYPKVLSQDIEIIRSINPNINIFAPSTAEMYPRKVKAKTHAFHGLDAVMEGTDRPGHFNGVITIVSKLFDAIQPHRAYFGEKDFQQLQIIKNWAKNNAIPTQIIACPIVREPHGLAMSSRNALLSKAIREEAGFMYTTLESCATGNKTLTEIYEEIETAFNAHPNFSLHYALCVNETTLQEVSAIDKSQQQRLFIAASVEGVRLIDNIALK